VVIVVVMVVVMVVVRAVVRMAAAPTVVGIVCWERSH